MCQLGGQGYLVKSALKWVLNKRAIRNKHTYYLHTYSKLFMFNKFGDLIESSLSLLEINSFESFHTTKISSDFKFFTLNVEFKLG